MYRLQAHSEFGWGAIGRQQWQPRGKNHVTCNQFVGECPFALTEATF